MFDSKDSAPKFLYSKVESRPGQQRAGKITVEDRLRRDMRVLLTTCHKEAFSLVSPFRAGTQVPYGGLGQRHFQDGWRGGDRDLSLLNPPDKLHTSPDPDPLLLRGPEQFRREAWSDATSAVGSSITGLAVLYV